MRSWLSAPRQDADGFRKASLYGAVHGGSLRSSGLRTVGKAFNKPGDGFALT